MAQTNRQVRMFAAEDYFAVYDSYINANLKAFDFDTIRESMVAYIQAQYPENFNDWIESSDFVALLDVVAQFGHNFAFRNDLNSRNNFLSTAERQDSVFKLGEFLGYVPRRNVPASGQLKITSVKTNEQVLGSDGSTLAGKEIRFENTSNNSIDDFINVLNSVFSINNQYGNPRKRASIDSVLYEFYSMENTSNQVVFEFNGVVQGSSSPFNVYGLDLDSSKNKTIEMHPDPDNSFSVVYKNDGRGVTSKNTGFFTGFTQGSLAFRDFTIDEPISNLTLDIDSDNINNSDVWVQTINSDGSKISNWTKVDSVNGFNEIYNDIQSKQRQIFSVKSRADNQISILFPDESFGKIPQGLIRVWYRTGVNQSYVLRTDDIGNKKINIKYVGDDGNIYTLTMGVALQEPVTNASASESLDAIKQNAPRSFAAQNRMITGDDYNNLIITQSEQIAKVKCINRTHSGHSRYINPMDPTGKYTNLNLFATDGTVTFEKTTVQNNTNNLSAEEIFDRFIKTELDNQELINLYYHEYRTKFKTEKENSTEVLRWEPIDQTSGYFLDVDNNVKSNVDGYLRFMEVGSVLKLKDVDTDAITWAKVINVSNHGLGVDDTASGVASGLNHRGGGAITLDREVKSDHMLELVYSPFPRQFTRTEKETIVDAIRNIGENPFVIYYDHESMQLKIQNQQTDVGIVFDPNDEYPHPTDFTPMYDRWFIMVQPSATAGDVVVTTRVLRYNIASEQIEFTNISNEYKLDYRTKKKKRDSIEVFANGESFGRFYVYGYKFDSNGVFYSDSVNLVLEDADSDQRPDNPELFHMLSELQALNNKTLTDLRFEWKHVPDDNEIIDPGFSNIIDAFVLTRSYDNEYRNWLIKTDDSLLNAPLAPTSNQLTRQFKSIADKKSISDTVVYRPVKYKVLFGAKASEENRASFSVVKSVTSTITDNEIKSRIVDAIYEFFEVENWDFGETFYFTELAAYVHKALSGEISSFVIVPESSNSVFGKLFQITPLNDELFIPDVSLTDIDITEKVTAENIKAIG